MFTDIKVGYACNNRCVHCVVEPARRSLEQRARAIDSTTEHVLATIDEAAARGSRAVVLTGGEVTLRHDFPLLLDRAKAHGLEIAVQTNGRRLEHWHGVGVLDGLQASFTVAVHGPDAAVHDDITRQRGSYRETMLGLRALARHPDIAVTGKLVMSKRNQDVLVRTVESLVAIGLRRFNIAFPHAEGFSPADLEAVVPRYLAVTEEIRRCAELAEHSCLDVEFETVPYCVTPNSPLVWKRSADAALLLQSLENPGFIRAAGDERLHDWELERRQIKRKGSQCAACVFDKVCEGPWQEYVETYGSAELVAIGDPDVIYLLD